MKILVTSGGTKIPIDRVRDITNMSKGTFGSKIATEFLELGHEVDFFKAKYSRSPFEINYNLYDLYGNCDMAQEYFNKKCDFARRCRQRYSETDYSTFDEYKERLERIVKIGLPDVVVLAAAVSDYGVENPHKGKVRSNDMLSIKLTLLPKLINLIKEWHPECKLVGFKLLVDSKDHQLIEAAQRSIAENKCDMIVANDLADIKNGEHRVHLVFPGAEGITYHTDPNDPNYLARMVAQHVVNL
jgi:phosphopantothenate---cysteine ligase (CTP)